MSYAASLLEEADIAYHIADGHMSALEGSIGALARRLLVTPDGLVPARRILEEAGLGAELRPPGDG